MVLDRSAAWGLLVLGAVGCGPAVVSESSSASSTATAGSSTSDSASGGSTSTTVGTTAPADGTRGTSTTADDAGSTAAQQCCEPDAPIAFEAQLPAGFTPTEALALFQDVTTPLDWTTTVGMADTVLHVDAAYVGGEVLAGPGGVDCTLFLNIPCNDGITMDVELTLLSDDGALDWTVPARIEGNPAWVLRAEVELVDIAGNAGTLATWPLEMGGRPFVLDAIHLSIERDDGGPPSLTLVGRSAAGDESLLATE